MRLTKTEYAIWRGQQMHPDVPLYNTGILFELQGSLDPTRFQAAFEQLVKSARVLRTVVAEKDGQPTFDVVDKIEVPIDFLDWSLEGKSEEDVASFFQKKNEQFLDPTTRAFESILLKLKNERFFWFLNQHHILTDAVSTQLIYNCQMQLYLEGELQSEQLQQNLRKSKENAVGKPPAAPNTTVSEFFDQRPSVDSRSTRHSLKLGSEKTKQIHDFAKARGLEMWNEEIGRHNFFLMVTSSFLHLMTGKNKTTLGSTINNRQGASDRSNLGLFIEMASYRSSMQQPKTLSGFVEHAKEQLFDFWKSVGDGSGLGNTGSFNCLLNYLGVEYANFADISTNVSWFHTGHHDPYMDCRIQVHDFNGEGNYTIDFDLKEEVFDASRRQLFVSTYAALLDAFLTDTDKDWATLSNELFRLPQPKDDGDYVDVLTQYQQQLQSYPAAPAVRTDTNICSYEDLEVLANQMAQYVSKARCEAQSLVLHLPRSLEYIAGVICALKLGIPFVPMPIDGPIKRKEQILKDLVNPLLLYHPMLSDPPETVNSLAINTDELSGFPTTFESPPIDSEQIAYILYTSGSTGTPKGVEVRRNSLSAYLTHAMEYYSEGAGLHFPLFTSIGFDLTLTSTLLPLTTGGSVSVYKESKEPMDLTVSQAIQNEHINAIKLTPSHLRLLHSEDLRHSKVHKMIIGGENLTFDLTKKVYEYIPNEISIYNEYGPTEATIGCILYELEGTYANLSNVPIGRPFPNTNVRIIGETGLVVPQGVPGELYLSGSSLARGYYRRPDLTSASFAASVSSDEALVYKTGDLAHIDSAGTLHYHGRLDDQIKINGIRTEVGEISAALSAYPGLTASVIDVSGGSSLDQVDYCNVCGIPSHYPDITFDAEGVCNVCRDYPKYKAQVSKYFKSRRELHDLLTHPPFEVDTYDCLMLFSGGKDSSYALAQLVDMNLKVLAYSFDNGFISDEAKANIKQITTKLGVDHVYGYTEEMNNIFVDSLKRYSNVCNGCFKTMYTLSTKLALEKKIPFVVTGLSRGQFFETRLSEELFWRSEKNPEEIDHSILEARKAYHRVDDIIKRSLSTDFFETDEVFEKVQFVDFYRYSDVTLEDLYRYLKEKLGWVRPSDTGRSTNCLINEVGIYYHKKTKGYHNYSFPYSWDVRVGHKMREQTIHELSEEIDENNALQVLKQIGFPTHEMEDEGQQLAAYYQSDKQLNEQDLRAFLQQFVAAAQVPRSFHRVDELPLTANGKLDKIALRKLKGKGSERRRNVIAPVTKMEELVLEVWKKVFPTVRLSMDDNFVDLGGTSLEAIRLVSLLKDRLRIEISLMTFLDQQSIRSLSTHLMEEIKKRMAK